MDKQKIKNNQSSYKDGITFCNVTFYIYRVIVVDWRYSRNVPYVV